MRGAQEASRGSSGKPTLAELTHCNGELLEGVVQGSDSS